MSNFIIGKCAMCGIDMIVGTPIENNIVCNNCYVKYEKNKIDFLQELNNKQKQQITDLQSQLAKKDKNQNQKAIEQLKKVKEELVKLGQDYSLNLCGIKIYNFVDDQINELKGKVKNERN